MDPISRELGLFLYQHRNFGGKVVRDKTLPTIPIIALEDAVEFTLFVNQNGQPAVNVMPIGTMTVNHSLGIMSTMSKDSPFYKAYYQSIGNIKIV